MDLKDIMAISGKPGLFKFVSQGKNSMIVEDMETHQRTSAFTTAKINALDDIAVYTDKEEVALRDVLRKVFDKEEGKEMPSSKSTPDELKTWFASVLPDYDRERVYVSDIKKIIKWYHLLLKLDMLHFEEKEKADNQDVEKDKDQSKTEITNKVEAKAQPKTKNANSKTTPAEAETKDSGNGV